MLDFPGINGLLDDVNHFIYVGYVDLPAAKSSNVGFRVASTVPATPLPALSPLGMAALLGLMALAGGYALRRRVHGSA